MNDRASREVMAAAEGNSAMKMLLEMTNNFLAIIVMVLMGATWLLGFVFAKGAWSTSFCILPFYAWYLDIERLAIALHWV